MNFISFWWPDLVPGGVSASKFVAELLAGPMWGGREGGPGCPSGQPGKDRAGRDYDATLFLNRQHAEPLNMQRILFSFCNSTQTWTTSTVCPVEPWLRQRVRPGRSGESGCACVCAEAVLTAHLQDQFIIRSISVASQFSAPVAGRSSHRPWV